MGENSNLFRYSTAFSSDDMSHFFRPILAGGPQARGENSGWLIPSLKPGISGIDGCEWGSSGSGGGFLGAASENDTDEYECESEDHLEAVVDEAPPKPAPSRGSSKRSRAAEVHNLSEKRRRSRINEKMKALQNLIPNSNKTDKASMLDEAIEYLKQLQLQVQMLSMRNGLNLNPMCLPGVIQPPAQVPQTRVSFSEENRSLHINSNSSNTLPMTQEALAQPIFSLPNQCTTSNLPPAQNMSSITNSKPLFGLEPSIQAQFRQFQLLPSSTDDMCRGDVMPHIQPNMNHSKRNHPSEFDMVTMSSVSFPFNTHDNVLLQNLEHNAIAPSHLTRGMGMGTGIGSCSRDDIKIQRRGF